MPLFQPVTPDIHTALAAELIRHGNDTFEYIKARYIDAYDRLWNREGFTVEDVQKVIDAMGNNAIPTFMVNYAFGQFITSVDPTALQAEKLASPVLYEVTEEGKIVFDKDAKYPTEPAVQE